MKEKPVHVTVAVLDPCQLVKSKFIVGFDQSNDKSIKSDTIGTGSTTVLEFYDHGSFRTFPLQDLPDHDNDPKKTNAKEKTGWKRCLGLILAVLSSVVFSLSITVAKYLHNYHAFNLGVWRSLGVFLPSMIACMYYYSVEKKPIFEKIWPLTDSQRRKTVFLLILRSILGAFATILQFCALNYISPGDTSVISLSTPIFVTILAFFFLGEELGIVSIIAAFTTLLGVITISRPPFLTGHQAFDTMTLFGVGFALSAMAFTTLVFLLLRKINDVHYSVAGLFLGGTGVILCLILSLIFGVAEFPNGLFDWMMGIVLALTSFLGQSLLSIAFMYEQAGPISLVRTSDVIFAFIWQLILFGDNPDIFSIIGALIIIGTVLLIGCKKWLSSLPEDNSARQKLWFILK